MSQQITLQSEDVLLHGTVENVTYYNSENGYAICDFGTDNHDLITITGNMPYVTEGEQLNISGHWVNHPKYGRQFEVTGIEHQLPQDTDDIFRYLSSGVIKGLGPKTAERIVEMFGLDTFDVIENHPTYLADVKGINAARALEISKAFVEQGDMRKISLYFRPYFGTVLVYKIFKALGKNAIEMAEKNPYILCANVDGIGFQKADDFAKGIGFDRDGVERIRAALVYLLDEECMGAGHTCMLYDALVEKCVSTLHCDKEKTFSALEEQLRDRILLRVEKQNKTYVTTAKYYYAERNIARKLSRLKNAVSIISGDNVNALIDREEVENGMSYALQQKRAIYASLNEGVFILTGGPGTGKTTVVRALLHIFDDLGYKVALCAPTGRAAKRLSESTSSYAATIHRMLEFSYDETTKKGKFNRDEKNQLEQNVIIVDEFSMVDVLLMDGLLDAIKTGTRLILIGDTDQLPSVGAGNLLHDLVASGCFSTVTLNEIFRQSAESLIVQNAHHVNQGKMPVLNVKNSDFFFLERTDEESISATVVDLVVRRLPKTYGDIAISGTQVICSGRKGVCGTESLNFAIQQKCNPHQEDKKEYKHKGTTFREGDRVMQIRNNYELEWKRSYDKGTGIFNGDIGVIEEIDLFGDKMTVQFDDRTVEYPMGYIDDLDLAYAITVHKSQGSEYPFVVMPIANFAPLLMTRNLLYTAITRGTMMDILVGKTDALKYMVDNHMQVQRDTMLGEFLCQK